jgi:hypothetical protein
MQEVQMLLASQQHLKASDWGQPFLPFKARCEWNCHWPEPQKGKIWDVTLPNIIYTFEYCQKVLQKKKKKKKTSVTKCNHVFVCMYVCLDVCVGTCLFMCVLDACAATCVYVHICMLVENREFTTLWFISQTPSTYFWDRVSWWSEMYHIN